MEIETSFGGNINRGDIIHNNYVRNVGCLKSDTHRDFLGWLLLGARARPLPGPVGGARSGGGCRGALEHGHQPLVNRPTGLPPLLQQEEDHGVFDQRREHEENADHEIEVNGIET